MSVADDKWEALGPWEADPVGGTPQQLEVIDEKLHLFYVGKDASVHYLVFDPDTGNWQGKAVRVTLTGEWFLS